LAASQAPPLGVSELSWAGHITDVNHMRFYINTPQNYWAYCTFIAIGGYGDDPFPE